MAKWQQGKKNTLESLVLVHKRETKDLTPHLVQQRNDVSGQNYWDSTWLRWKQPATFLPRAKLHKPTTTPLHSHTQGHRANAPRDTKVSPSMFPLLPSWAGDTSRRRCRTALCSTHTQTRKFCNCSPSATHQQSQNPASDTGNTHQMKPSPVPRGEYIWLLADPSCLAPNLPWGCYWGEQLQKGLWRYRVPGPGIRGVYRSCLWACAGFEHPCSTLSITMLQYF